MPPVPGPFRHPRTGEACRRHALPSEASLQPGTVRQHGLDGADVALRPGVAPRRRIEPGTHAVPPLARVISRPAPAAFPVVEEADGGGVVVDVEGRAAAADDRARAVTCGDVPARDVAGMADGRTLATTAVAPSAAKSS